MKSVSRLYSLILPFVVISVFTTSCNIGSKSKDDASEVTESTAENSTKTEDPAEAVRKAFESIGTGAQGVEPVDHRNLKDMLGEKIRGFNRVSHESQSAGAMGFNISMAEANYETSDGKKIQAALADTGGAGMAIMSMAAWSSLTLDKEDQNGWERTSTYKGYKSFEKYDKVNNSSELAVIIGKRFVLTLNGTKCSVDDLKKFADEIPVDSLKKFI